MPVDRTSRGIEHRQHGATLEIVDSGQFGVVQEQNQVGYGLISSFDQFSAEISCRRVGERRGARC